MRKRIRKCCSCQRCHGNDEIVCDLLTTVFDLVVGGKNIS